jgi:Cof subfamily protein (haloacid dehalogenase superfamily)
MPIRLVAIDIDGTLLDSRGDVPERTIVALGAAIAAGTEIAIATGRRYDFAKPILDQLPRPLTAIVSNGAVVRSSDGATALRRPLPKQVAGEVLGATRPWRVGAALAFDRPREGQIVFERIDWGHPVRRAYAERSREFISETAPLEDALVDDPLQVMFNGSVAEMRALVAHLTTHDVASSVSLAATEYPARDFTLVDVLTAGCTKGSTMAEWATRQGYRRDEVMALGDNLNDLEMLEAAGLPVVMGNAVPELRGRGWAVTGTNDDAGVALAIERWVLGE